MDLTGMSQGDVVDALAELGRRWREPRDPWRRQAAAIDEPFSYAMVQVSLDALLECLTPAMLWSWIDSEDARDVCGPASVGHVIAGNTPLLAWTSLIRALLVRSRSRVKLPSGGASQWGQLFRSSLADVSPALAASIDLDRWRGGDNDREPVFAAGVDLLLVYGRDQTIAAWRAMCRPPTVLIGYGHRVSCGLVLRESASRGAASGLARDVLLYDQGGCLSPHTVFVEGDISQAQAFAAALADALAVAAAEYPLPGRAPEAAARVQEARALARMAGARRLWEDPALRWTVIVREERTFVPSPTHGVVSVQPLASPDALAGALAPVHHLLQGCAVAGGDETLHRDLARRFTYLCSPGSLQAPPLWWAQDGIAPLRSLRRERPGGIPRLRGVLQ